MKAKHVAGWARLPKQLKQLKQAKTSSVFNGRMLRIWGDATKQILKNSV